MNKRVRQYVGLLSAVIAYYLIHEGVIFCTPYLSVPLSRLTLWGWECKLIYMLKR